jgi:hypothetical protein
VNAHGDLERRIPMSRLKIGFLVLAMSATTATEVFAWEFDFTKEQRAAAGKHCVHGFFSNESTVAYYFGDAAQINLDLPKLLEGRYATRTVVLHVGTMPAATSWDKKARDTFADWSIQTFDDPADATKAVPRMRLQVDIWLGGKINLEKISVPKEFEVVSGGEIEKFIQERKRKSK